MEKEFKVDVLKKGEKSNGEKCVGEVNKIMEKYNCRFAVQQLYDDGVQIDQQVIIREITNESKKPN